MRALTIHNHQKKAHGRAGGSPICGGMGHRAPTFDGRKSSPEQLPSLPASGRSLRGGCAARRQTGARAGGSAGMMPAIRPTRLGWCFTRPLQFLELARLTKAGVDSRVAAQLVANHSAASGSFQGITERHPVHQPASFPDQHFHAPNRSDGAHGSVPGQAGELPTQRGERPDVGGS